MGGSYVSGNSSVGRAPDCRGFAAIRRSMVRIREAGLLFKLDVPDKLFNTRSLIITLKMQHARQTNDHIW